MNEGSRNEEEVLIAPFCRVSKMEKVSKWDGYTYYAAELRKSKLPEKSDEELENLRKQVIEGFQDNLLNMQQYLRCKDEREYYENSYQTARDEGEPSEELFRLAKNKREARENEREKWSVINQYRTKLESLMKGLCRKKEIEIDKAYSIVEEYDKEIERKQYEEQQRKLNEEARQNLAEKIYESKNEGTKLSNNLGDFSNRLFAQEERLREITIGNWKPHRENFDIDEIVRKIKGIQTNIQETNSDIAEERNKTQEENIETKVFNNAITQINQYVNGSKKGNREINGLNELIDTYRNEANLRNKKRDIKKG